ncbi:hypothetical protein NMG60_11001159 [Bertholletia excelsa]
MDSISPTSNNDGGVVAPREKEVDASMVDPFLVEALQNPRHRLTILRMELDIQKFLQNSDLQQFEFQHFPTSYLRLAAHRVAQYYGLQTSVQENVLGGPGTRIVVKKLPESGYPSVCLSQIPARQSEYEKHEQVKIVMRPRLNRASSNEASEAGVKCNPARSMEERKEEYDRARARIFSTPASPESEDSMLQASLDGKNMCVNEDVNEGCNKTIVDLEKALSITESGTSSRVAIFKDREKDRTDPDYDRSYERYVKNPVNPTFSLTSFNMPEFQPPYLQYDAAFPHLVGQMPRTEGSLSYSTHIMSPFCATGFNQTSRDAAYTQWPTSAMMYAQSYDQFRRAVFQAPYCQQPLSFDYSQSRCWRT